VNEGVYMSRQLVIPKPVGRVRKLCSEDACYRSRMIVEGCEWVSEEEECWKPRVRGIYRVLEAKNRRFTNSNSRVCDYTS
jgi:hypothetical protein